MRTRTPSTARIRISVHSHCTVCLSVSQPVSACLPCLSVWSPSFPAQQQAIIIEKSLLLRFVFATGCDVGGPGSPRLLSRILSPRCSGNIMRITVASQPACARQSLIWSKVKSASLQKPKSACRVRMPLLQNTLKTRSRAHARASHGHGSPLPQQWPQFQASHHIPRPALLTCSVHLGRHGHEEWGPKTSGSVTNTKHDPSSSLEQSANLESSAPPQRHRIKASFPSVQLSDAHPRPLPSPSADTSAGLG